MDFQLRIRQVFFMIYDALSVCAAGLLALITRFDFSLVMLRQGETQYLEHFYEQLPFMIGITICVYFVFHLYSSLWTYAGVTEIMYVFCAAVVDAVVILIMYQLAYRVDGYPEPRSFYILFGLFMLGLSLAGRFFFRIMRIIKGRMAGNNKDCKKVLVIGAGQAGNNIIKEISESAYVNKRVVGVIDDSPERMGRYIHGSLILGGRDKIVEACSNLNVDEIIIALPSADATQMKEIVDICKETGCDLKRLPALSQLVNGEVSVTQLQDVDVIDLLGREPITVDIDSIMGYVTDKVVLVTGGGGSIGSELCRQVAGHRPKQLIIVDIYENNAYDIQQELVKKYEDLNLVVLIASVRNTKRINDIFAHYKPDIVYHAAAHKHVPLMEMAPNEAVKNNVLGTWKVVQAADRYNVKRFVMISTDKAVNPTNIMGATKRLCEMIVQTYNNRSKTEFVAVRFGNVLGSNGSVIPLFKKQIAAGGPVTVTHPDIVRYFMTIPEAVSLVLQAGAYAKGGEIFVLDMGEPVKIVDLARNLILLSGHHPDEDIKIEFTGLRPGEKLYEEMLMKEEGLQDTPNKLIHIGKPIEIDEEKFLSELSDLAEYVVTEPDDIRTRVQHLVPTYSIQK